MNHRRPHPRHSHRRAGGVAAILAMMFLMIFGSLAAAMAIVSHANFATADSHLKVNRARAASETGLYFLLYRIEEVARTIRTRDGVIDSSNAGDLWLDLRAALMDELVYEFHNLAEPSVDGLSLTVGPIALGPNDPRFIATLTPHPLPGEDYGSAYYSRPPYSEMTPAVTAGAPLDATWIRIRVEAFDGPINADGTATSSAIGRSIQMDLRMEKKIRFAILSKSRVMIGSHVMVDGPIGSRFMDTHLPMGHPIQMKSDFDGLSSDLDSELDTFVATLALLDRNGDNRLELSDAAEVAGIDDPETFDANGDGFIDEYDFFLTEFDANGDGGVSAAELDTLNNIRTAQLLTLIDTFGDPTREGYDDGVIDEMDRYAKIHGEIRLKADFAGWNDGSADGMIQDYFQGSIKPGHDANPLTFSDPDADLHEYGPADFDMSTFRDAATGDLFVQATAQAANYDPDDPTSPQPLGQQTFEEVPFGSAHPYDYYDRPIFENMTFTNVKIPKGTNALFRNCRFIGVTFVETETANTDSNFNYSGMVEADGNEKHADRLSNVDGVAVLDTKLHGANIRFDNCTFEGAVTSDSPEAYTHVRNKLAFTGQTRFEIEGSENLTEAEKTLYRRSTLLAPHFSVEMGTFLSPDDPSESLELSGAIVAGVLDMRGQIRVDGTIITTFEPQVDTGPVLGETSPQFNTTLGYFASNEGDLEAEIPDQGLGVIHLRYDPDMPLPDGILGPIELTPIHATYFEGGASWSTSYAPEAADSDGS